MARLQGGFWTKHSMRDQATKARSEHPWRQPTSVAQAGPFAVAWPPSLLFTAAAACQHMACSYGPLLLMNMSFLHAVNQGWAAEPLFFHV